jgi:hypothetical protein
MSFIFVSFFLWENYYNSVTITSYVMLGVPWTATRWQKNYENVGVPKTATRYQQP